MKSKKRRKRRILGEKKDEEGRSKKRRKKEGKKDRCEACECTIPGSARLSLLLDLYMSVKEKET